MKQMKWIQTHMTNLTQSYHEKKHSNHHEQKHSDHEESHHLSIELLGILSGLVLMGGHLINLRREKTNSVEEECST